MRRLLGLIALCATLAAACTPTPETAPPTTAPAPLPSVPTTSVTAPDPGFYLMLMWHQHQPFYPKDADGVYTRPWVRVHATKDYYDMAAMVERYPGVKAVFNLTPVLLLQLEDLAGGAKDLYWVKAEIPADQLTVTDKRFILERFFDINPKIIDRFPRYRELADDRNARGTDGALAAWSEDDFRDLQVLFNLGWTDPDFLAIEPLVTLVDRQEQFTEADKATLFAEHLRIISEVIDLHARLWEAGVIEVTTTPLAHPILPLISDTSLAAVGDPLARLPADRFREIPDADQQVIRGLDVAERLLGRRPVGMWPAEGSVAQLVMSLFSKNGVRWVASGEDALAKSLDIGSFTRDSRDVVAESEVLYRPWEATLKRNDPVAMFFRDVRLSDQLGFEYSGTSGQAAADDFMRRLQDIRESVDVEAARNAGRPYVVSVILDGENAWEHYDNDGKDFLDALYSRLRDSDWVQTITPSEYLDRFAQPEPLEEVFPASWFQPNFATWIGEDEEAVAWEYLFEVRDDLKKAVRSGEHTAEALEAAYEKMLFAEGSDWFWWYGADQNSGDDSYFDTAYRELLGQVYDALGMARPAFVGVPIIPERPVAADRSPVDLLTIDIDGRDDDAWADAGSYASSAPLAWAFDREHLFVRLDTDGPAELYLGAPEGATEAQTSGGALLGFGATHALRWNGTDACVVAPPSGQAAQCSPVASAVLPGGFEAAIPLATLGVVESGDLVLARLIEGDNSSPAAGPMSFQIPDISNVVLLVDVEDPIGDDHGPGTYTYPTDGVFVPGSYDLTRFQVGTENDDLVFTFEVVAPIANPWGSPRGLSVQTFDVYVDTDPGAGTGARLLIPGRNAALESGNGWEYAVTVEGWDPAVYIAAADGTLEETKPSLNVITFGEKGKVVVRIARTMFGEGDPSAWGFAAVVMSQEGFPSPGVRRVRDVAGAAQQWQLGGAPPGINHTRIIDVASGTPGEQEAMLSDYTTVDTGTTGDLGPDDFGKVPLNLAS